MKPYVSPLVIYVYTRSVKQKRRRVLDPQTTVIVAKQIVLVLSTIQIYWFRHENNVLLMLIDQVHAQWMLSEILLRVLSQYALLIVTKKISSQTDQVRLNFV